MNDIKDEIKNRYGKNNPAYKHGKTNTRLYQIWRGIKKRCYVPTHKYYKHYGGRGIIVCDEWKNNFMNFYDWAVRNNYNEKLTIDRIDVNGNYEPNNCRWVTQSEQLKNKTNNVYISYKGRTQTMSDWAKEFGLKQNVFRQRYILGWSMEKIQKTEVKNVYRH